MARRSDVAASAFNEAIVAMGSILELFKSKITRVGRSDFAWATISSVVAANVISMPRCFAVVRTLERKKRSSTDARIATRRSYIPRRQTLFVVERDPVSDCPGDERDQEPRNRHRAPGVEQQPLV